VNFRTTVAHTFAFLFAAARSHVRVQFVARCSGRRLICLVCARSRYTQLAPEEIVPTISKNCYIWCVSKTATDGTKLYRAQDIFTKFANPRSVAVWVRCLDVEMFKRASRNTSILTYRYELVMID
jgi:hypothetical protein